jgi:hypothetical protein
LKQKLLHNAVLLQLLLLLPAGIDSEWITTISNTKRNESHVKRK